MTANFPWWDQLFRYLGKVEICQLLHTFTLLGEGCNLRVWVSDKLLKKNSQNQSLSKNKINYGPLLWSGASPSSQTELSVPSPWREPGTRPLCCLVSERKKNMSKANFLWMQYLEQMSCCPLGQWVMNWRMTPIELLLGLRFDSIQLNTRPIKKSTLPNAKNNGMTTLTTILPPSSFSSVLASHFSKRFSSAPASAWG